jgi:uncharacterized protein
MNFEAAVASWLGLPSPACTFAEKCGRALIIEHDGGVFSCDHYVYPQHRLGQIHEADLAELANGDRQAEFGTMKADRLPQYCHRCEALFACRGECPKNRFIRAPDGEAGLNYLCKGLRQFFAHVDPWMVMMADEIRAGRGADNVMRAQAGRSASVAVDRAPRRAMKGR